MLLLSINGKAYFGESNDITHLTLGDHERLKSRSFRFRSNISRKGAASGHMLLLNINRKACIGGPLVRLHLTLSDLGRSMSRVTQISKAYIS